MTIYPPLQQYVGSGCVQDSSAQVEVTKAVLSAGWLLQRNHDVICLAAKENANDNFKCRYG